MDIWHLISFFFIYAFLGWVIETVHFFIHERRFVKRGFLYGPLCPIYAIGMIMIIGSLTPYSSNPFLLACVGAFNASLLELATGFLMDKIFKIKWWDYTGKKYNLGGYICLENCFYWFVLSLVAFYFIHPFVDHLVDSVFMFTWYKVLILSLSAVTFLDTVFTALGLAGLLGRIIKIEALKRSISLTDNGRTLTDKELAEAVYKDRRDKIETQINAIILKRSLYIRKLMTAYPHATSKLEAPSKVKALFKKHPLKKK